MNGITATGRRHRGSGERQDQTGRVWKKIPDESGTAIVKLALEEPDLSPREIAVKFTDTKGSFVFEASVYRILKENDLIASPAFI